MTELSDEQNKWYQKLKADGFKDIELDWCKGKAKIRETLRAPHPKGKRSDNKYHLSGDRSILLERYASAFIVDKREKAFFADVVDGVSIRSAALKNKLKKFRGIYLINKALRKIKSDLKLETVPEYLRCPENVDFERKLDESTT